MQQRETLQARVYRDILSRICEGELPDGSSLPTLKDLSRQYRVSDNCIRAVIGNLRENGYLSTARGRPARIVAPSEPTIPPAPAQSYEDPKLQPFHEAIHILFPSIYIHASLSCTEEQIAELGQVISRLSSGGEGDNVTLNIRFYRTVLSSVRNDLLLSIVQTVMQNAVLPAALIQKKIDPSGGEILRSTSALCQIYAAILEKNPDHIKAAWTHLFEILEFMVQTANADSRGSPDGENRVFTGLQYAGEFKYLLIAHDLYEKILEGKYPVGTFLPSISKAQVLYGAAKTTIQAAYRLLVNFEIVATTHGRGTEVVQLSFGTIPLFQDDMRHSQKEKYGETIELLQIICEDIILHVHNPPLQLLMEQLEGSLNPSHLYSALILCRFLMQETCDPALDTFYQTISRRLYWGVYFKGAGITPEEKHGLCIKIVEALEQQRPDRAIGLTRELLAALGQNAAGHS